jgi:hypothetical protein
MEGETQAEAAAPDDQASVKSTADTEHPENADENDDVSNLSFFPIFSR